MTLRGVLMSMAAGWLVVAAPLPAEESSGSPSPMQVISLQEWRSIVKPRPADVVVVADLWASWCVSCIERFPRMVEMAERFRDRSVRFVTLNLDDPQDRSGIDWSNDFLATLGGEFSHYHLAENMVLSFEELDLMSLPVVLIYDGSGEERFRLTNDNPNQQFTESDVEAAIVELLSEHKPGLE